MVTDPPADARWGRSVRLALGPASALGFARFAYGLLIPAGAIIHLGRHPAR